MAKKQQKTHAPQTTDERIEYFNQIEENLSNRVVNCQLRVHKLNRQIASLEGKCSDVHISQRALGLTPDEAKAQVKTIKDKINGKRVEMRRFANILVQASSHLADVHASLYDPHSALSDRFLERARTGDLPLIDIEFDHDEQSVYQRELY